jgi:hypothetical protein
MTKKADASAKPDGSAYDTYLAGIAERNVAAKKVGKAQRAERELALAKVRVESERLQEAGLRKHPAGRSR